MEIVEINLKFFLATTPSRVNCCLCDYIHLGLSTCGFVHACVCVATERIFFNTSLVSHHVYSAVVLLHVVLEFSSCVYIQLSFIVTCLIFLVLISSYECSVCLLNK